MTEKPVMCGCGGEAKYSHDKSSSELCGMYERFYLTCDKCGAMVGADTIDELVRKWNTAMSGNRVRLHNVIFEDEREPVKPFRDANPKRWRCGNCGSAVKKPWAYCQKCGVKIEWKEERNARSV